MSVEAIIDRIFADAEQETKKIHDEASEQARSIQDEINREADDYFVRRKAWLDEKYRKEKERAVLNKRLEHRKNVLASRQEWMGRAFERAYTRLVDQPIKDYGKLMKKLIMSASTNREELVIFGKKGEQGDLKNIITELNKENEGKFSLSDKRGEFPWGVILNKGKIETNMSIESLFKYKRNDLEQKAWELFNADA
jgi:V/A-type H+-transporting ATPase subunit E